jgi:NTE family protein
MRGLFLSGGGARGAYQTGVLKALADIAGPGGNSPFELLSGVSAGAINTAFLASHAEHFTNACHDLAALWSDLTCNQIYRTGSISLLRGGMGFLWRGVSHSRNPTERGQSLLHTKPLKALLRDHIDFSQIANNIEQGHLKGIEISSINYSSSETVAFYDAAYPVQDWQRHRRHSKAEKITCEHVLASAALPIFFPAVEVDGHYYGDGSLRNMAPLSPLIRLGASRILVVDVAHKVDAEMMMRSQAAHLHPSIGRIFGLLLNSILMDNLERDLDALQRINEKLDVLHPATRSQLSWRPIEVMILRPSEDLAAYASTQISAIPPQLRYMIGMLGSQDQNSELLSYLNFEAPFCQYLIKVGYQDTMAQREELRRFLQL